MSGNLRAQIRDRMDLKETAELLEIWQNNYRFEWSEEAFEIVREILKARGVEIPVQDEPVYEAEKIEDEEADEDGLEEWEAKLLDEEDQPEFYDTLEDLKLKDNINKVTKAVVVIYALQSIPAFQQLSQTIASYFRDRQTFMPLIYFFSFIFVVLGSGISIAIVYFPLKALSQILRILMEMEFKSRKGNQPTSPAE
jgi:hypothetical protein